MRNQKKRLKWILMVPVCVVVILAVGFLLYTAEYYHADSTALSALEPDPESDDAVTVTKTEYGWYFDGPSERDALVFYPGAKVEETAYAPLLRLLAAEGMDVCLVKMPFHLAFFGANNAGDVMAEYDYEHWYVGGHSLGGAMAANYAAEYGAEVTDDSAELAELGSGLTEDGAEVASHDSKLTGLVLLAAYPTKQLDESLSVVSIYGSEDGVLNMENLAKGDAYLPKTALKCVIEGGNHAQFGNYGAQDGDGEASISAEEQQRKTVEMILSQR